MGAEFKNLAQHTLSAALWIAVCVQSNLLVAAEPDARTAVEVRMRSVATLIEDSSASRTVESSELSEPCARRARARALLEEARRLLERGGEPERMHALLDEATQEMLAAVRLVKQTPSAPADGAREFDSVKASLTALLDAYVRIRSEADTSQAKDELQLLVESALTQAEMLRDKGELQRGLTTLSDAYAATRAAIDHQRGGETLVRELHFETEADEYAYEIDRNDSLRMLVDILLRERIAANVSLAELVSREMQASDALRQESELLADKQSYVAAIASLESSTKILIRAIRSAGIYIPE